MAAPQHYTKTGTFGDTIKNSSATSKFNYDHNQGQKNVSFETTTNRAPYPYSERQERMSPQMMNNTKRKNPWKMANKYCKMRAAKRR
jgi:hypothetical protein